MDWMLSRLDWMIAWRHLRSGERTPAWVQLLTFASLYLIVAGAGLARYAAHLDQAVVPSVDTITLELMQGDPWGSSLASNFRTFGFATLLVGAMSLVLALLARFFSLLPTIIAMSVLLGSMALVVVLGVQSGLEGDMREKIIGQRAHIRVSQAQGRPFADYTELAQALAGAPGVVGASPYLEGEVMVLSPFNRQGAILAGIIPELHAQASDLPRLVQEGDYGYLSDPSQIPQPDPFSVDFGATPFRLRHLDRPSARGQGPGAEGGGDDASPGGEPGDAASPASESGNDALPGGEPGNDALLEGELGSDALPGIEHTTRSPVGESSDEGGTKLPPREPSDSDEDSSGAAGQQRPAVAPGELPDDPWLGLRRLPPPPADNGWEDPIEELGLSAPGLTDAAEAGDDESPWAATFKVHEPVLIGRELASELSVGLGSEVQLVTSMGRMTPAGPIPGVRMVTVAGVFFSGMYEYDRKNVYAPLPVVQKFLLSGDRVTGIEVKLADVDDLDRGKLEVQAVVDRLGRGDELIVEDWRDLNRNLFSAMFLEKVAIFIALMFVVLVASFGILASNLMSVMEKNKEIAILKAMGCGDQGILRVFVTEGLCVGLLGDLAGIGLGLGLSWVFATYGLPLGDSFAYADKLPVVVHPADVALVGVAVLVVVCLSSLYPALVASRLRPVEALRQADR